MDDNPVDKESRVREHHGSQGRNAYARFKNLMDALASETKKELMANGFIAKPSKYLKMIRTTLYVVVLCATLLDLGCTTARKEYERGIRLSKDGRHEEALQAFEPLDPLPSRRRIWPIRKSFPTCSTTVAITAVSGTKPTS